MSSRESISITSGFVRIIRDVTDVTSYTIEGHSQSNVTPALGHLAQLGTGNSMWYCCAFLGTPKLPFNVAFELHGKWPFRVKFARKENSPFPRVL